MKHALIIALFSAVGCGQTVDDHHLIIVPGSPPSDLASTPADLARTPTDDLARSPSEDLSSTPADLASAAPVDMANGSDMACSNWAGACTMTAQCCLTWSGLPMDAMNVQVYCDTARGQCVGEYQFRDGCFGSDTRKCTVDSTGQTCTGCTP